MAQVKRIGLREGSRIRIILKEGSEITATVNSRNGSDDGLIVDTENGRREIFFNEIETFFEQK